MTLLLIAASWTLILALITGLCAAARLGDRDQAKHASVAVGSEALAPMSITAHANTARTARTSEAGAPLAGAGSLAA